MIRISLTALVESAFSWGRQEGTSPLPPSPSSMLSPSSKLDALKQGDSGSHKIPGWRNQNRALGFTQVRNEPLLDLEALITVSLLLPTARES